MSFNHGKEESTFMKEWEKTEKALADAGISEEKIHSFYEFEREQFNSDRKFYEKNSFQEENQIEDNTEPYYDDYFCEPEDWQENIENPKLCIAINLLTEKQKNLVSKIYVEGFDVGDICIVKGVSRQSVHSMKGAALKKMKKKMSK